MLVVKALHFRLIAASVAASASLGLSHAQLGTPLFQGGMLAEAGSAADSEPITTNGVATAEVLNNGVVTALASSSDQASFDSSFVSLSLQTQVATPIAGSTSAGTSDNSIQFTIQAGYYYFHEDYAANPGTGYAIFGSYGLPPQYGEILSPAVVFVSGPGAQGLPIVYGPAAWYSYTSPVSGSVDWSGYLSAGKIYLAYSDDVNGGLAGNTGWANSNIYFGTSPAPVPEPWSFIPLGLGCAGIVLRRQRRL